MHAYTRVRAHMQSRQSRVELYSAAAARRGQPSTEEDLHTELEDLQEHLREMEGCGMGPETAAAEKQGSRGPRGRGGEGERGPKGSRGPGRSLGGQPSAEAQAESRRLLAHQQMLQVGALAVCWCRGPASLRAATPVQKGVPPCVYSCVRLLNWGPCEDT